MSTTVVQDRLQPALLDRLTDDDPGHALERDEKRVMNRARLREAVLRDLSWLFNTSVASQGKDFEGFPEVRRSVLNYGLPALSGQTLSSIDPAQLELQVRTAIVNYEPRIIARSLKVEVLISEQQVSQHNQISFRIAGQLWAQPIPLELLLHTRIDLETGQVEIRNLAG